MRLAATLALLTATALAGGWTMLELNPWTTGWFGFEQHGTSVSLGVGVWAAWLLAAVVHVVAPGRWTRLAIGLALVLTVAVVPLAALLDRSRPPLFVLLAQACLGLVAVGVRGQPPVWLRLLPLAGAAAALPVAATLARNGGDVLGGYYGWPAGRVPAQRRDGASFGDVARRRRAGGAQRPPWCLGTAGAALPDRHAVAASAGRRTRRQPVRRRTERGLDDS